MLNKLTKEVQRGFYDDWATDYLEDVLERKPTDAEKKHIVDAVVDFLQCREIEIITERKERYDEGFGDGYNDGIADAKDNGDFNKNLN